MIGSWKRGERRERARRWRKLLSISSSWDRLHFLPLGVCLAEVAAASFLLTAGLSLRDSSTRSRPNLRSPQPTSPSIAFPDRLPPLLPTGFRFSSKEEEEEEISSSFFLPPPPSLPPPPPFLFLAHRSQRKLEEAFDSWIFLLFCYQQGELTRGYCSTVLHLITRFGV